MRISKSNILAITMSLCLGLVACGDSKSKPTTEATTEATTEPTTQNAQLPVYTVAINKNYPPFEISDDSLNMDGFDVDLLNAIAEKEQFAVEYKPFDDTLDIIDSVKDGKFDMSASSIFITEERKKILDFSEVYFTMPIYLVGIEKENRLTNIDNLTNTTIVLEKDHFLLQKIMDENLIPKGNTSIVADSNFLAFKKLAMGEADLMLENIMTISDYSELLGDTKLFYLPLPEKDAIQLGYITQKGNQELIDKLNRGLKTIKSDGTYDKIYNKWFSNVTTIIEKNNS